MRCLLLSIGLLLCLNTFAQIQLPQRDGRVYYEFIDSVPGVAKDDLYLAAKRWLVKTFNDAEAVIQSEDREAGMILGKGVVIFLTGKGIDQKNYNYRTTIELTLKDSRYRLRFYDLNYLSREYNDVPVERQYTAYREKSNGPRIFHSLLEGLDKEMHDLRNSLQTELSKGSDDF